MLGTVFSLLGVFGSPTQNNFQYHLPSPQVFLEWALPVSSRSEGLNGLPVKAQAASPGAPPYFSIVLIRMMASVTSSWLAFMILSLQQLINSSIMKLPVVTGSMHIAMTKHLFVVSVSEYLTEVGFPNTTLLSRPCYLHSIYGESRISSERFVRCPPHPARRRICAHVCFNLSATFLNKISGFPRYDLYSLRFILS